MSDQLEINSKTSSKKPTILILSLSALAIVALTAVTAFWTANVSSSARAICVSGKSARADLVIGVEKLKPFYGSDLLQLTSLRVLNYERSQTLHYSDYSGQVLKNLDSIDAELDGNPISALMNSDLKATVGALRNGYKKLNDIVADIEANPATAQLYEVLLAQIDDLDMFYFIGFKMYVDPIKKLRYDRSVDLVAKLSGQVFPDSVGLSLNAAYDDIASANVQLNKICKQ
jgi:hypothetical protein